MQPLLLLKGRRPLLLCCCCCLKLALLNQRLHPEEHKAQRQALGEKVGEEQNLTGRGGIGGQLPLGNPAKPSVLKECYMMMTAADC